jgi:hypothetical protein
MTPDDNRTARERADWMEAQARQLPAGPLRDAVMMAVASYRAGLDRDRALVAQMAATVFATGAFDDGDDAARISVRAARELLAEVDRV